MAPTISVIVPAHNAEALLPRCLAALATSSYPPCEVIVVDDRSSDRTRAVAREAGARVLETAVGRGPGAARNSGARQASGDILLFVDADVEVRPDTVLRVAEHFDDPDTAAVFGSYDDEPLEPGFLSQYKNLQHHYVHQTSNSAATTFWAGCGAVRRPVFLDLNGFDIERYPEPSIEDIELGYRMKNRGYRTTLDRRICVKHLKRWRFWPLLRTEISCRAKPWSELILQNKEIVRDLNLKTGDRASAGLTWLLLLLPPLIPFFRSAALVWAACLAAVLWLNRGFYGFLLRRHGLGFLMRAVPMHLLYFAYSSATFAACWLRFRWRGV